MSSRLEIPPGARVEGLLQCDAADVDVVIEGKVDGIVELSGSLRIARGASCTAAIRAKRVRVVGGVIGDITATELIEVGAGGRVVGDMRAPDISVDASASVDGRVDLLPPGPELAPLDRIEVSPDQISGWRPTRPKPPVSAAPTLKIPPAPDLD